MGWSFRRSITLGPFRINFSKSGVSYSVGAAGFRTGVNAKGRRYSSFTVPGTGLRYQKYHKKKDAGDSEPAKDSANAEKPKSRTKRKSSS